MRIAAHGLASPSENSVASEIGDRNPGETRRLIDDDSTWRLSMMVSLSATLRVPAR